MEMSKKELWTKMFFDMMDQIENNTDKSKESPIAPEVAAPLGQTNLQDSFSEDPFMDESEEPIKYRRILSDDERCNNTISATFTKEDHKAMRKFLLEYGQRIGIFNNGAAVVRALLLYFKDNHETINLSKYRGK